MKLLDKANQSNQIKVPGAIDESYYLDGLVRFIFLDFFILNCVPRIRLYRGWVILSIWVVGGFKNKRFRVYLIYGWPLWINLALKIVYLVL